jgi:hypothetical protein
MEVPTSQQHLHVDDAVKQLLDQAQGAIQASNASQALQVLLISASELFTTTPVRMS